MLYTEGNMELIGDGRIVDCQNLRILAQDTSPRGRYRLADAVSEFFADQDLNELEHRLVVEIMMSLIHRAELDIRQALAEKLSLLPNVPSEVIIYLANDEISVARPVLRRSEVLNDADLVYIISSKTEEYWRTIADRDRLSPAVVGRLIDTGDIGTAVMLADNPRLSLPKAAVRRLIKSSLKDETLQASLMRRPELDRELAVDLYACVSRVLRREITQKFKIPQELIDSSLENLIEELSLDSQGAAHITHEMETLAKRFKERGEISPVFMIKVLRRGQVSFFIALFSEEMGLPVEAVLRLIRKDGGKPFAIACRSIGMMKSEFASIYLLSRALRTQEKVVDQQELADVLRHYDTVKDFDVQRQRKEWVREPATI